ncbi:lipopolysaccharide biosynthesis protein [Clostridiaceae bacterium]|nr:lipopolysaccharide biosynthesis protein [Lachnospiraceae bacterium]NBH16080.1 lipopolysaccharide biosynthesis protein [Clostridiaceae bacterium]
MDKERQNILWNMAGSFCYAFASMVLSFLVMRMVGKEEGGVFAFGYSTFGQQMFIVAYFGIRPFQVTDGAGEYRFGDYFLHRCLTCMAAVAAGAVYLLFYGYGPWKAGVIFLLVCYKVIDGFADVYESEFQRTGNLHLTGKSNTFRTLLSVGVFLIVLWTGGSLLWACGAAVAAQVAGVLIFDLPVSRRLPSIDWGMDVRRLIPLTKATVLLFISVFLDFYIFSAAKYAIDAYMDDVASGYFNVIFMPTSVINLAAGFVIRPVLTYLTGYWEQKRYERFVSMLGKISWLIMALSMLALVLAWILGKPVLTILERILGAAYTGSLTAYHSAFVVVILGGGFYAILNLYYYVLVILRRQTVIFGIYGVLTVLAWILAPMFVKQGGILGAAWVYLILMIFMAAGFIVGAWVFYFREK